MRLITNKQLTTVVIQIQYQLCWTWWKVEIACPWADPFQNDTFLPFHGFVALGQKMSQPSFID
jgi:hypothetical protein